MHALYNAVDYAIRGGTSTGSHGNNAPWVIWVLGPIFVLVGIGNLLKPDLFWRLNRWQYKNKDAFEPSRAGLIATRIGGGIFVIVGIVLLVIAITR